MELSFLTAAPPGQLNCTIHGTVCGNTRLFSYDLDTKHSVTLSNNNLFFFFFFTLSGSNANDDKSLLNCAPLWVETSLSQWAFHSLVDLMHFRLFFLFHFLFIFFIF